MNQCQNQNQYQTEVLCNELAILNSMIQDSEVLSSTAAGNSFFKQECGLKPNITLESLGEAESQHSNGQYSSLCVSPIFGGGGILLRPAVTIH